MSQRGLITADGSGIGRAMAEGFARARAGARITDVTRDPQIRAPGTRGVKPA